MKKWILGLAAVMGICATASAEDGEWLPVREREGLTWSIYSADYDYHEGVFKNATGQVWMRGVKDEENTGLRVIHGRSDCQGKVVTIDYDYVDGKEDRTVKEVPVEPEKVSGLVDRVICTELNIGD